MVAVNIRDLTHNFSSYLKNVKSGERIVIMERNIPIADIIPHNPHVKQAGWKRSIERVKIKGEPLSKTVVRMRRESDR